MKRIALFAACVALLALVLACDPNGANPDHFTVLSVSGEHSARALDALARSFELPVAHGHIDAGPPESLTFTLFAIRLNGTFDGGGTVQTIWDGGTEGVEITVSGNGAVDLTDVQDISDLPVGEVTEVVLVISPTARMVGTIENAHVAGTTVEALYTKAASAYNALTKSGGASSYEAFTTGPAEEIETYFNGGDNLAFQEIHCPVNSTLGTGSMPKLTILFDVSRALRFYDGLGGTNGGPSPDDVTDKAYFFSHSVLTNSIVCFFGESGSIEGYQTLYDNTAAGATSLIPGWMTLIFDANDDIQSGILIGDDDNAGTVLKGLVRASTATTVSAGVFDFTYDISDVTVSGFTRVTAVGQFADATWVQNIAPNGGGTARYTLGLVIEPE